MRQTTQSSLIQVRIDENVKNKADALFTDLGFDTPTAIRMFLNQAIRREGMPFDIVKQHNSEKKTLDKQILEAFQKLNVPVVKLEADTNGSINIDEKIKEEHPDIYDWAVNG